MFANASQSPFIRNKGKKPAVIWEYFVKIEGSTDAQCVACDSAVARNQGTTSTMISHLKKFHVNDYKKYEVDQKAAKLNLSLKKSEMDDSLQRIKRDKQDIIKILKEDGLDDGKINKVLDFDATINTELGINVGGVHNDEDRLGPGEIDEINRVLNYEKSPTNTMNNKESFSLPKQEMSLGQMLTKELCKEEPIKKNVNLNIGMVKHSAPIWKFFYQEEGRPDIAKCNDCHEEVGRPKGTTSGMMGHLQGKHKRIYKEFQKCKNDGKKKQSRESFLPTPDEFENDEPKLVIDENKGEAESLNHVTEMVPQDEPSKNVAKHNIKVEFIKNGEDFKPVIDFTNQEDNSIELKFFTLGTNNTAAKCNFCGKYVVNEKNYMIDHLKSEGHKAYWNKYLRYKEMKSHDNLDTKDNFNQSFEQNESINVSPQEQNKSNANVSSVFNQYTNLSKSIKEVENILDDKNTKKESSTNKEISTETEVSLESVENIAPRRQPWKKDVIWSFYEKQRGFVRCNFCEEVLGVPNPTLMVEHLRSKGHGVAFQQYSKMKQDQSLESIKVNQYEDDVKNVSKEDENQSKEPANHRENELSDEQDDNHRENELSDEQDENNEEDFLNQEILKREEIAKLWNTWNESNEEIAALEKKKNDIMKKISESNQDLSEIKLKAALSQMIPNFYDGKAHKKRKRDSDSFGESKRVKLDESD